MCCHSSACLQVSGRLPWVFIYSSGEAGKLVAGLEECTTAGFYYCHLINLINVCNEIGVISV